MTKIRARTGRKEPTVSRAAYEKVAADYDAVVADYKKLASKHKAAVAKFNALAAEHGELSAKYAKSQDVMGALAGLLRRGDASGEARGGAGSEHVDEIERLMDAMVAAQNGRGVRGDGRHLVWFRSALLDEYIQDDKLLHDLTLLEPIMFEYIAYRVEEYVEAHGGRLYCELKARRSDPGNRSKLNTRYIVFVSFFAKRTNAPPAVIGALFGMHRTTARRQLEFMDGVLENVLPGAATMQKRLAAVKDSAEFIEFTGGELMHDGTLARAPDSTDIDNAETSGYSGKHREPGFNTPWRARVVAAIAIRSLAAQMLCGLALTAKPWRIFSPMLAGRHSSIPNCGLMDGKIEPYCGMARGQSSGRGAATSRIP